jgi:copper homeostasis protein CutC
MSWNFVYDSHFARVYDQDSNEAVDLQWDGEVMKVSTSADHVEMNITKVIQLRKALQWVERQAKKEGE